MSMIINEIGILIAPYCIEDDIEQEMFNKVFNFLYMTSGCLAIKDQSSYLVSDFLLCCTILDK